MPCQVCVLGFHFCSSYRISANSWVFFIDTVKPVAQRNFPEDISALIHTHVGTCLGKAPPLQAGLFCVRTASSRCGRIFIYMRGENLSLSLSQSKRIIRDGGQWCGSGILHFNSISGEQHPVLIFHFILFFLRASLLV